MERPKKNELKVFKVQYEFCVQIIPILYGVCVLTAKEMSADFTNLVLAKKIPYIFVQVIPPLYNGQ